MSGIIENILHSTHDNLGTEMTANSIRADINTRNNKQLEIFNYTNEAIVDEFYNVDTEKEIDNYNKEGETKKTFKSLGLIAAGVGIAVAGFFATKVLKVKSVAKQGNIQDVIDNMLKQRRNIVTEEGKIEDILFHYKQNYVGQNRYISNCIADEIGIPKIDCGWPDLNFLDKIIRQCSIPKDIVLYRGLSPYDWGLPAGMESKDFLDIVYKKGKIFTMPKYIETSLLEERGKDFAKDGKILFKLNVPKNTNGIYMERLGKAEQAFGNEEEIMLARNLSCKFKNRQVVDGQEIIEVDILKRKPILKKIHKFWQEVNKNEYIHMVDFDDF